jgi:hypothetical protein
VLHALNGCRLQLHRSLIDRDFQNGIGEARKQTADSSGSAIQQVGSVQLGCEDASQAGLFNADSDQQADVNEISHEATDEFIDAMAKWVPDGAQETMQMCRAISVMPRRLAGKQMPSFFIPQQITGFKSNRQLVCRALNQLGPIPAGS